MELTATQTQRVVTEWSAIAGETVKVEKITDAIYAFCSELGALRLEHKMKCGHADYSTNLGTWFYCNKS